MLSHLSVRNVVLIQELDLEFASGLTALTGETGAGKSILLDALGMAAGARSDRGLVRSGTDKAQTVASFDLPDGHDVWAILEDHDLDFENSEPLRLRRTISSDGRSRAYVNDQAVGVRVLAQIGQALLEVHGQHDGRGLLDPLQHLDMLDQYGQCGRHREAVREAWTSLARIKSDHAKLLGKQEKASEDREFLDLAIAELDRLDPREGEEDTLVGERRFLQNAEGALNELTAAQDTLGEGGAFEDRLSQALSGIDRVKDKLGGAENAAAQALEAASSALDRALLETQEARSAVAHAADAFDVEPGKLDQVEQRLFALRAASRKFGVPINNLTQKRAEFSKERDAIESVDADIAALTKKKREAEDAYHLAAKYLRLARLKAAQDLDAKVARELPPLKMDRAQFVTRVEEIAPTETGIDEVRFQVSTNPGTPLGPLEKIASGGELARFALAIKVALADQTGRVMVFDEVDQGVGGAVAAAVGRRLSTLSTSAQVFVVTHSPQVAACADHQFRIAKTSTEAATNTHVHAVSADEREEEIARMLAGDTITDAARAAARQLIDD